VCVRERERREDAPQFPILLFLPKRIGMGKKGADG
jgi:hypothetical protein